MKRVILPVLTAALVLALASQASAGSYTTVVKTYEYGHSDHHEKVKKTIHILGHILLWDDHDKTKKVVVYKEKDHYCNVCNKHYKYGHKHHHGQQKYHRGHAYGKRKHYQKVCRYSH